MKLQSQLQTLQQNVELISIYAMQRGTEDNMYPQLLDFPNFLRNLISQVYAIQRTFVNSAGLDRSALPQVNSFLSQVAYSNLCTLHTFNYSSLLIGNCSLINNQILTKGLYSSLISYLE